MKNNFLDYANCYNQANCNLNSHLNCQPIIFHCYKKLLFYTINKVLLVMWEGHKYKIQ